MSKEEVIEFLNDNDINSVILFKAIYFSLMTIPEDQALTEGEIGTAPPLVEMAAWVLSPDFETKRSNAPTRNQFETVYEMLNELLMEPMRTSFATLINQGAKRPIDLFVDNLKTSTRIVRGAGYPQQTKKQILDVLCPFDNDFKQKLNTNGTEALAWLDCYYNCIQTNIEGINKKTLEKIKEKYGDEIPDNPDVEKDFFIEKFSDNNLTLVSKSKLIEETHLRDEDLESFLNVFSIKRNFQQITRFEDVQKYPVVEIGDGIVIIERNILLDQIFYRFDQEAKTMPTYQNYQNARGKYLEGEVENRFEKMFPGLVKSTLDYPDLEKGGAATAELDILILFPPYIFLIEAKSSQFRFESQMGDLSRFKTDVEKNLFDAYEQTLRAMNYIQTETSPVLKVRSTGEEIAINKETYNKFILCTVSLNHLANVATKLSSLEEVGFFEFKSQMPWSVCLAELDILFRFLSKRSYLLYYLERRLELQRQDRTFASDEVDYIGCYIQSRLNFEEFGLDGSEKYASIWLGGQHNIIDAAMGAYGHEPNPDLDLILPAYVKRSIHFLDSLLPNNAALSAIFKLLGANSALLSRFDEALQEVLEGQYQDGKFKRAMIRLGNILIVLAGSVSHSRELHKAYLVEVLEAEKYRLRTFSAVGLMINPREDDPFLDFAHLEGPWKFNPVMESTVSSMPRKFDLGKKVKVGRNTPCPCGSGKKFKRCHGVEG